MSIYVDKALRDVEIKRVFHPNDKNLGKAVRETGDKANRFYDSQRKTLKNSSVQTKTLD